VTGSNKGIGFSIVKFLCQQFDGDVYLTARDEKRGKAAVSELENLLLHPKFHQLDIDDPDSVRRLRDHLKDNYGGLDVLVNNAGIAYKVTQRCTKGLVARRTYAILTQSNFFFSLNIYFRAKPFWLRSIDTLVSIYSSAFRHRARDGWISRRISRDRTKTVLNRVPVIFRDSKDGANVEKGWGSSAYNISKVGVTVLTFIQQREFNGDSREDLVVNAVHPGFVSTDMSSHRGLLTPDQGKNYSSDRALLSPYLSDAATYLALLPPNVESPKGQFVWNDRKVTPWDEE
ncbi:unnamed protein product, partial [Ixodes hexagonus]